jgi:NTP pyrophosphatase (non-canonical NTP hydrolase)
VSVDKLLAFAENEIPLSPITHGSPMPLPTTKYTAPTYAAIEPKIRAWAAHRQITYADGRPRLGTIAGQYSKVLEELGEAILALSKLGKSQVLQERCLDLGWHSCVSTVALTIKARRHDLALEFGDVLVTLTLLAAMHGVTLEACLVQAPYCPGPVQTWHFIYEHSAGLGDRLAGDSIRIPSAIGSIALCVIDQSRITLELSGPECLALALAKIEGRDGEMIDGVFVKDTVTV